MAPVHSAVGHYFSLRNATGSGTEANPATDLSDAAAWSGSFTLASVDLIAMIVSDSGLSSSSPEWWNCSPLGCLLIGIQPRGGWQVMQRAVQWGDGYLSRAFGIRCDMTDLYKYFTCSTRNRLEVWKSEDFVSPTVDPEEDLQPVKRSMIVRLLSPYAWIPRRTEQQRRGALPCFSSSNRNPKQPSATPSPSRSTSATRKPDKPVPKSKESDVRTWRQGIEIQGRGVFNVRRPTKLLEGSKGGPAFICSLLNPPKNEAYSIAQQARMQMLSVILVAAGLTKVQTGDKPADRIWRVLENDMAMNPRFSSAFDRFRYYLAAADVIVLSYVTFAYYCLFRHNYFHTGVSYAVQVASLASWSAGAIGLLALGGNPRVKISSSVTNIPQHVLRRLFEHPEGLFSSLELAPGGEKDTEKEKEVRLENALSRCKPKNVDGQGNIRLQFGYLQSTHYSPGDDSCTVHFEELKKICGLKMTIVRPVPWWYITFFWFVAHLLASITLQIFMADVMTLGSQVLGVIILISTSLLRGAGIASPEEWMIPKFKMREGAHYGANLLSKTESRKV